MVYDNFCYWLDYYYCDDDCHYYYRETTTKDDDTNDSAARVVPFLSLPASVLVRRAGDVIPQVVRRVAPPSDTQHDNDDNNDENIANRISLLPPTHLNDGNSLILPDQTDQNLARASE